MKLFSLILLVVLVSGCHQEKSEIKTTNEIETKQEIMDQSSDKLTLEMIDKNRKEREMEEGRDRKKE